MTHPEDCERCEVYQRVRAVLESNRLPGDKIRAVEMALNAPPARPVRTMTRDVDQWPQLSADAWERHDDPELS
ncbi:hypothetical protein OG474_09905 [Kribbella sp. NBC_01505]|uniref:hypothetical protein n=1 Tax=Kribbella sp. NBC_01505 TaxID=2903580 RepID=UPI00386CE60A